LDSFFLFDGDAEVGDVSLFGDWRNRVFDADLAAMLQNFTVVIYGFS
jgi:hypothetical protein